MSRHPILQRVVPVVDHQTFHRGLCVCVHTRACVCARWFRSACSFKCGKESRVSCTRTPGRPRFDYRRFHSLVTVPRTARQQTFGVGGLSVPVIPPVVDEIHRFGPGEHYPQVFPTEPFLHPTFFRIWEVLIFKLSRNRERQRREGKAGLQWFWKSSSNWPCVCVCVCVRVLISWWPVAIVSPLRLRRVGEV